MAPCLIRSPGMSSWGRESSQVEPSKGQTARTKVDYLEQCGYLIRKAHPTDNRGEIVILTERGFRGCLALATKGQKFKRYSQETKLKAIELKLGGKTKREIIKELGIEDEGQIKKWMRKYKQLGEYRLMDNRGRRMQDVQRIIDLIMILQQTNPIRNVSRILLSTACSIRRFTCP